MSPYPVPMCLQYDSDSYSRIAARPANQHDDSKLAERRAQQQQRNSAAGQLSENGQL